MRKTTAAVVVLALMLLQAISSAPGALAQPGLRFAKPGMTVRLQPTVAYVQQQLIQQIQLVSSYPYDELELELPAPRNTEVVVLVKPRVRPFLSYGVAGYAYETVRAL